MSGPGIIQWIYIIFMMIAVIVLMYYTMKFLQSRVRQFGQGNNMKIIETLPVSQKGFVHIVKIGEEFVLLGVTENQVTYLKNLDEFDIEVKEEVPNHQFRNIFNTLKKKEDDHEE
jgi:flagellar protein FliO/FliZ